MLQWPSGTYWTLQFLALHELAAVPPLALRALQCPNHPPWLYCQSPSHEDNNKYLQVAWTRFCSLQVLLWRVAVKSM